jgi:sec-independent protein translocase protein TatB
MLGIRLTKIALIVPGPKNLVWICPRGKAALRPRVAISNDVKAEVTLDVELDELRRMKSLFESATSNV